MDTVFSTLPNDVGLPIGLLYKYYAKNLDMTKKDYTKKMHKLCDRGKVVKCLVDVESEDGQGVEEKTVYFRSDVLKQILDEK